MTTDRIKEIQAETAYPNSTSVQQALLKVWNECEQEQKQVKNCSIPVVVGQSEQFYCWTDDCKHEPCSVQCEDCKNDPLNKQ